METQIASSDSTRWYLLDIEPLKNRAYRCLCYEGDHLVDWKYIVERMSAIEYGDQWSSRNV